MFQNLIPVISKGFPSLKISPFDPLSIKNISVHRTTGEVITLNGTFDDLNIYGPSNSTVTNAYLNLDKKILNFKLEIPKLRLNSSYNLKGMKKEKKN